MYHRLDQLPNLYVEDDQIVPGFQLREFIMSVYPRESFDSLNQADQDFQGEGEISSFFYFSFINFLVRRLITAADFTYRKYKNYGDGRVKAEIRSYLEYYTSFSGSNLSKVASLLFQCLQAAFDNITETSKRAIRYQAKKYDWKCFTCGCELNYDDEQNDRYGTFDHNWPRSLGGPSEQENVRLVCKECNSKYKKNFIDGPDYHFEEISLPTLSYDDYEKSKRYYRGYEFAVLAKSNFKCDGCGSPAYKVGELKMGRKQNSDSWHFFNLVAYCSKCHNEK